MSSSEDSDVEEIAKKLHQVYIEKDRLRDIEQALRDKLLKARNKRKNDPRRGRQASRKERKEVGAISGRVSDEALRPQKTDRYGKILKVGDRVESLTPGKVLGHFWTIYKLTEKRVLLEKHNGDHKTHRDYKNVRKVD